MFWGWWDFKGGVVVYFKVLFINFFNIEVEEGLIELYIFIGYFDLVEEYVWYILIFNLLLFNYYFMLVNICYLMGDYEVVLVVVEVVL